MHNAEASAPYGLEQVFLFEQTWTTHPSNPKLSDSELCVAMSGGDELSISTTPPKLSPLDETVFKRRLKTVGRQQTHYTEEGPIRLRPHTANITFIPTHSGNIELAVRKGTGSWDLENVPEIQGIEMDILTNTLYSSGATYGHNLKDSEDLGRVNCDGATVYRRGFSVKAGVQYTLYINPTVDATTIVARFSYANIDQPLCE